MKYICLFKKKLFLLYFILIFLNLKGQNWNLVWQDEFNNSSLDTSKWIHEIGTGSQYNLWGWGNNELQYYQPGNTEIYNGTLKIIAKEEPSGITDNWGVTKYFSSSRITTKSLHDFKFGKIQARIKTLNGEGFWPAFWMLPTNGSWPCDGEIDIMEQWGNNGNTSVSTGAAHLGNCPYSQSAHFYNSFNYNIASGSYADDFHIYEIRWQQDKISWFIDNVLVYTVTPNMYPAGYNWPFNNNDWYLILNLAITSNGPSNSTTFPSQIEVDWVRVYDYVGDINGCTDANAQNYNANANIDDGSCQYLVNFEVNLNCFDSTTKPNTIYITGPSDNWSCNYYQLNDNDNDGVWSGSFSLTQGNFTYVYCGDNWNFTEGPSLLQEMLNGESCAPNTDYYSYANREIVISGDTTIYNSWGKCEECIAGCTDSSAVNYNINANYEDSTCIYNNNFNVTFKLDMNNFPFLFNNPEVNGTFNNWCGNCWQMSDFNGDNIWEFNISLPSGNYEYKYSVDNWAYSENLLNVGSCVFSSWGYTNRVLNLNSDTVLSLVCWESCTSCNLHSGCTDSIASNYNPLATVNDSSCIYLCDAITGINLTEIIHDRVKFNWNNMNQGSCLVDQIRIRYRPIGTTTYFYKTMGSPVGNNVPCFNNSKLVLNLSASTQYEYEFKIWYQDGTIVNWHSAGTFTTASSCLNATNVIVNPINATKANFSWDAPLSAWSFVRLKYRIDTVGTLFSNIGGFGVQSPNLSKVKNGLTPGTDYRVIWRTWCSQSGGPYRSPQWDGPVKWTQPHSTRLEDFENIYNINVYPNPSKDVFNLKFISEDFQNFSVRVSNSIGEVIFKENIEEFYGEYEKLIDLTIYPKGVYFLVIKSNFNIINKKIIKI